MKYRIGWECNRCRLCLEVCKEGAIKSQGDLLVITDQCRECGECAVVCPVGAIYQGEEDSDEM